MTSTDQAATPAKKQAGTEYVVLARTRTKSTEAANSITFGREQWDVVDTVDAASAEQAIRQLAQREIERPTTGNEARTSATLVAVPLRSWSPSTVTVTSRPVVTLEDA